MVIERRLRLRYMLLFIPWLLALLLKDNPISSYLIAWTGSFFILHVVLTGGIKPLPADLSIAEQLMRPIFLVQAIFIGYMCCTSVFYFLDVLGYVDFKKVNAFSFIDTERLKLTAQCQRYYCLAQAAFTCGILTFMKYPVDQKYTCDRMALSKLIFIIAIALPFLSHFLGSFAGLSQFSHQFNKLSFIAAPLALSLAIQERKLIRTGLCILIYGFSFYQSMISGFKEPIILSVLVLGIFLYPKSKKIIVLTFIPILIVLSMVLPAYNQIFRNHAWKEKLQVKAASDLALNSILDADVFKDDYWTFLVCRLSEINMFTLYIQSSPREVDYYGLQLLKQSLTTVVPRIFWPSKPVTETLVMERVYRAGIASRHSDVSAKPAFVVDAYLSGGTIAIAVLLFIYGAACQLISIKAEQLFGGYTLGTALVFSGLFQTFWRGQSLEFLVNTVSWSYVSMYLIFWALRFSNILTSK